MGFVSPLAFVALVAILSHQPVLHMSEIVPITTSSVVRADGSKVETRVLGQTFCELTETPGKPDTWRVARLTYVRPIDLEHESLHGADCTDDGRMNGSLLPFAPTTDDSGHKWVWWAQANPEQAIAIMEGLTK